MAPGVTFWDAGEFIAAAHGFGIPHPPGTPLYVSLGRAWISITGSVLDSARAMNVLSALCSAATGAVMTRVVARELGARDAAWGAVAGVLCAGFMTSVWSNATETEVYAAVLLHVSIMLACASQATDERSDATERWVQCTAYAIALAPAVHLSALVGAPAAIALAARRGDRRWRLDRVLLLGGAAVATAGVGRLSSWLAAAGVALVLASPAAATHAERRRSIRTSLVVVSLASLAYSALFILLVRAGHDPALNQGNPSTLSALADVIARRQYDVAGLWPRQAPVWLQLANVAQYSDWQIALDWGRGIFTTPARVLATLAFVALAAAGARAMRRDARRLADAMLVLLVCGTLGVAAYLNFKAGASLGWGVLPDSAPHEARERDYFFVLGFWAWGCLAGYGAFALVRRHHGAPWWALACCVVPLVGNWRSADRSRPPESTAAHDVGRKLLEAAPRSAVLFTAGDNDSYPLWYARQVEGVRPDVLPVTLSLLPADWYVRALERRTGWRLRLDEPVAGARWTSEQRAALVARAARAADRPVAATPLVSAAERAFLGSRWRLAGPTYVSDGGPTGRTDPAMIDRAASLAWIRPSSLGRDRPPPKVDDVSDAMVRLLDCPRLALGAGRPGAAADSLEVKCNLR